MDTLGTEIHQLEAARGELVTKNQNLSAEISQANQEIQTLDQKAIALDKAQQAWNHLHHPVLVDDSGIYFDHYNNFPGTLTKFIYHGIGFEGILKLTQDDNRATHKLYMVFKDSDEEQHVFEGFCEGTIVEPESFESHPELPYDAVFMPKGASKTMAFMRGTEEEKKY